MISTGGASFGASCSFLGEYCDLCCIECGLEKEGDVLGNRDGPLGGWEL